MTDDQVKWPVRILVLDRGYIRVARVPDPQNYAIWLPYRDARTIRRWGTTAGLGQLVSGPTDDTVLDSITPSGTVPVRGVIDIIDAEEDGWAHHLQDSSPGSTKPENSGARRRRTGA